MVDQRRIDDQRWVDARTAARFLGIQLRSLYAYVSRGQVRSVPGERGRPRLYAHADLARLRARRDARSGHGAVAAGALRWGEPVLDSAITAITPRGPAYRGRLAVDLAAARIPFENVAELLWSGYLPEQRVAWPRAAIPLAPLSRLIADDARPLEVMSLLVQVAALADAGRHDRRPDAMIASGRRLIPLLAAALAPGLGAAVFTRAPPCHPSERVGLMAGAPPCHPSERVGLMAGAPPCHPSERVGLMAGAPPCHPSERVGLMAGAPPCHPSERVGLMAGAPPCHPSERVGLMAGAPPCHPSERVGLMAGAPPCHPSERVGLMAGALGAPSVADIATRALGLADEASPIVEMVLVILADHELNASSFTARIAASTEADPYACVAAALATLSGPQHGSASEDVARFADEVGGPDAARAHVRKLRKRGLVPPGFGHVLYPLGDPRARPLLDAAARIGGPRRTRTLLALVDATTDAHPTVDVGLAALVAALGAPPAAGSGLFAVARSAGWLAHALEQRAAGYVLRPRARYTGVAIT